MTPLRLVIADDHALFREALASLLTARGHLIVGEAANGAEAVRQVCEQNPDVVLMDLSMGELDGLEATRQVLAERPAVKVVVLTASDEDRHLFDAIKAGASGYLPKDLDAERFFALLEGVSRGEPALTPKLARKLLEEFAHPHDRGGTQHPDALTEREREVLDRMVAGVTTNRALADALGVSENTVKFHVRNILEKLRLNNRAQAVAFAYRSGLIEPDRKPRD